MEAADSVTADVPPGSEWRGYLEINQLHVGALQGPHLAAHRPSAATVGCFGHEGAVFDPQQSSTVAALNSEPLRHSDGGA